MGAMERDTILSRDTNSSLEQVNFINGSQSLPLLPLSSPVIAAYLITVVCLAVVSNTLVLIVFCRRRQKLGSFRLCVLSLAVSDILFSILLHPMSIATSLGCDPQVIFNEQGCLYFGFLALFFGTFDMTVHALLSIIRYLNLCQPSKVNWVRLRSVTTMLFAAVVYSAAWSFGPLVSWGQYETFEVGCTIAFEDHSVSGRTFVACAFIFIFFVPLAVIIYNYAAIVREVIRQRKDICRVGRVNRGSRRSQDRSLKNRDLLVHLKLIRMSALIATGFVVAWLPYAVVCLWAAYGDGSAIPQNFRIIAALFCKSAAAYNPFLYLFLSKSFRKELMTMVNCLVHYPESRRDLGSHSSFSGPTGTSSTRLGHSSRKSMTLRRHSRRQTSLKGPSVPPILTGGHDQSCLENTNVTEAVSAV